MNMFKMTGEKKIHTNRELAATLYVAYKLDYIHFMYPLRQCCWIAEKCEKKATKRNIKPRNIKPQKKNQATNQLFGIAAVE